MSRLPGPRRVLFLCTGNSARSIMAEALLNRLGEGRWMAQSAGSHPMGRVHPLALETLRAHGLSTDELRSKDMASVVTAAAPPLDLVVTVCDAAARQPCPVWPGAPATVHWSIADPAQEPADPQRFAEAFAELRDRIQALIAS